MKHQIDAVVEEFFSAFDNRNDRVVDLSGISCLFVPTALIVRSVGEASELLSVDEFIQPRQELLTDGSLRDFHEVELEASTFIFGDIACRTLRYAKTGFLDGSSFSGEGMKSMHFARLDGCWRITSIIWQDGTDTLPLRAAAWHRS